MKLYFAVNTCALAPHIVLREAGIPFELVEVDLRTKRTKMGADYKEMNPKGYVPALQLDDGELLTEAAVIAQFLADLKPQAKLAPPAGTMERVRLQEWLNFIATELHKATSPLYNPAANDAFKESLKERLTARFSILGERVQDRPYVMGEAFTIADPYAYYTLRSWQRLVRKDFPHPALQPYFDRIGARPAVRAALEAEAAATAK
jgi:glutathione S-transferase